MRAVGLLFERFLPAMVQLSVVLAATAVAAVTIERAHYGWRQWRQRRFAARYAPVVDRALQGDAAALRVLVQSPRRHRIRLGELLLLPLIRDRRPDRISRTRAVVEAMSLIDDADRLVESRLWWRRALALRAFGLIGVTARTPRIVAALDDPRAEVRAAALDALADLRDPASLGAVVVRLQDASLQRGRRVQALLAFGSTAEPFVLDLAEIDPAHRVHYARALAICGTPACRQVLYRWMQESSSEVRAACLMSLFYVGIDPEGARLAAASLDSDDVDVRRYAAGALHGWTGPPDAAATLARHLDDTWEVAVRAARALQAIAPRGVEELRGAAARVDLAGLLSRQMLWELDHR